MTSYIILLCSYSVFHFSLLQVKNIDNILRPMNLIGQIGKEDEKINIQHGAIGLPVFISFIIALFIYDYLSVILQTLALKVGLFFLLSLLKPLLKYIFYFYIGYIIFITKWITLLCVIYFILFEFITK